MKTNEPKKLKPRLLKPGDFAVITIKLEYRIPLDIFTNNRSMGRIAMRDGLEIIGSGIIEELKY